MLLRLKEDYDGAEPAASSVAAFNALTLAHSPATTRLRERRERTLGTVRPRVGAAGANDSDDAVCVVRLACGLVAGGDRRRRATARAAAAGSRTALFAVRDRHSDCRGVAAGGAVAAAAVYRGDDGRGTAAAYVCRDFHVPSAGHRARRCRARACCCGLGRLTSILEKR